MFSVAYRYRKSISIIDRVIYMIYMYVEFLASHFSDLARNLSGGW